MGLELILGATVLVSLVSFAGVVLLPYKGKTARMLMFAFVVFAVGTLLGAAFLDLLPEAIESADVSLVMQAVLAGILTFFIIEKVLYWHHHHGEHVEKEKPLAYLNLFGDGLHNFFDGAAIAASFLASTELGITTTIAVVLHEIPQEVGDFSLLLYSGLSRGKALLFNFLSALVAVIGALVFYYSSSIIGDLKPLGLAFTAGMFIYIATVDMLPELQKEPRFRKSLAQFFFIMLGIAAIWLITAFLE